LPDRVVHRICANAIAWPQRLRFGVLESCDAEQALMLSANRTGLTAGEAVIPACSGLSVTLADRLDNASMHLRGPTFVELDDSIQAACWIQQAAPALMCIPDRLQLHH
jgi:hypothetical protein